MKNFKGVLGFVLILGLATGCSKDDETSKLTLAVRTNKTQVAGPNKTASVNTLVVDKFLVNLTEIEFDIDNEMQPELPDSIESNEIVGPFVIDLASSETEKGLLLGATSIPAASYEDIEFEFDVCQDAKYPELKGHSVYVSGKINDKPFVMTYDKEWEVEIDFEDNSNFVFNGDPQKLFVDFNLFQVVTLAQNDFASAVDKNNDGKIEINPSNIDGNANLCQLIIKSFENAFDLDDKE